MCSLYDTHMHTPLCKHAVGMPGDYAAVAHERGLTGIIVTCHNPVLDWGPHVRMSPEQLPLYVELVENAAENWSGRVNILLGLECDYAPGHERWLESLLGKADFQYILGSVHPHLEEYRQRYWRNTSSEFFCTYYEHLAQAAETGLFDCLSHPDIVKNFDPLSWDPHAISPSICSALDRIATCDVAMELNTSGLQKKIPEMNPAPSILRWMKERDIPVVVGSDAHSPSRVAADFLPAYDLLTEVGYEEVCFYTNRSRQIVSIAKASSILRPSLAHVDAEL